MRIAFTGRSVLITAMAVFVAFMASGQSQQLTLHEGFVDVPGAKIYYTDSGGPAGVQDEDYRDAIKRLAPEGFDKNAANFSRALAVIRVANPDGVERWSAFESRNRAPQAV